MARTPTRQPAPRPARKPPTKAAAKAAANPQAARREAALGPGDALTDRTTLLYDPEAGRVAGAHRVLTLPGGAESADPAGAAEALEIPAPQRGRLVALRHDGPVAEGRRLVVETGSGKPVLALAPPLAPTLAQSPAPPRKRRPAG